MCVRACRAVMGFINSGAPLLICWSPVIFLWLEFCQVFKNWVKAYWAGSADLLDFPSLISLLVLQRGSNLGVENQDLIACVCNGFNGRTRFSFGKGGRILLNRARIIAKANEFYCLPDHLAWFFSHGCHTTNHSQPPLVYVLLFTWWTTWKHLDDPL